MRQQGIEVDDDNDPDPENTPQMNSTTTNADRIADTESNCTGAEGILCPRLERNLPDTPACFKNTLTKAS